MNFAELKHWVSIGVQRGDLESHIGSVVNQAIKHLCDARIWTFMKTSAEVTIKDGQSGVVLPGNFKELTDPDSAVTTAGLDGNGPITIQIIPKTEAQRLYQVGWGRAFPNYRGVKSINANTVPVYLDWDRDVPSLNFVQPVMGDITFRVDYYGYLEELVEDTDTNALTNSYPELVLSKSKGFLFEIINDDSAAALAEDAVQKYYQRAAAMDSRKRISGVKLRM
jgi:hypothetical protein